MKFVDEATIKVTAGKGGDGSASFRREKFIPFGGPNGGDGGDGGSVYLIAENAINTLVDFRYQREHRAKSGEKGGGAECTGRGGEDLIIPVPVGTLVYDIETQELLGDLKIAWVVIIHYALVDGHVEFKFGGELNKQFVNVIPVVPAAPEVAAETK